MSSDIAQSIQDQSKAKVFISYSRRDIAFVDRLEAALKARGLEPLIDRTDIYAFEPWWERIQRLIGQADTIVFVLSPEAVASDVALKEVAYAASLNKRFAPIVWRRVEDDAVPQPLRHLNFIFFDDPSCFDSSTERLVEALRTDIGWIRQHTEYGEAERRWSAAGRPRGLLLHSPTLEVAEYWLDSRPAGAPEPTEEVRKFVTAGRRGARAAQRLRRIAQVAIFSLMMAVILGLVGWINQSYIAEQWRWWTITRPYAAAHVWPHLLTVLQEQTLKPGESFKECAQDCPEMVVVPAGSYMMGGQTTHLVTIAKPFAVSKYLVTFGDWDGCVGAGGCNGYRPNDAFWGRARQPVIYVSWFDAQQYVSWLRQVTGKNYRLLTEAEYEYAARAGTTTVYPWGDDIKPNGRAMAVCVGCGSEWDNKRPAPVGSFPPNNFGLYDMVGNLWQWTEDCYHNSYDGAPPDGSAWTAGGNCERRIERGGSWADQPRYLRPAVRDSFSADGRAGILGFRVVRTLLPP